MADPTVATNFDVTYSGTTAVTLIVVKDMFIVSNAGDSRCISFRSDNAQQL